MQLKNMELKMNEESIITPIILDEKARMPEYCIASYKDPLPLNLNFLRCIFKRISYIWYNIPNLKEKVASPYRRSTRKSTVLYNFIWFIMFYSVYCYWKYSIHNAEKQVWWYKYLNTLKF